jgi:hypothetical protein
MAYAEFGKCGSLEKEIINAFDVLYGARQRGESEETAIRLLKTAMLEGHQTYPQEPALTYASLENIHIGNDRVYSNEDLELQGMNPRDTMPLGFAIKTAFGSDVYEPIELELLERNASMKADQWRSRANSTDQPQGFSR